MKRRGFFTRLTDFFRRNSCTPKEQVHEGDRLTIKHLRLAGSNLSKPHEVDFFLYFPTIAAATRAAEALCADGYATQIDKAATEESVLCQATMTLILDVVDMSRRTEQLNALAARYGGEYDGWETAVEA